MTETLKEYNLYKEDEEKLVDMLYQTTLKEYPGIPIPDEELAKELLRMGIQANRGVIEGTILKDYLVNYSEKDIQKIREEKMPLVTAAEFKAVHRQMLEQSTKLEEKLSFAVESLHFIEQGRFDAAEFARKVLAEIEREEE
ncbi:hypothetical protein [uncultured Lactococcus sp.]|uniref:hypothetical protein n=1 Tax=uncultured Lactococcus sp. TaxID=167973 RepID=UPI00205EA30B|nr:hypothetical protein [uncultured Lactococcus sp.]DAK67071.1 MAG TPA: DNTTIP1 dimerization domain protein [Caudoviricetes sp.]